jgi:hypothetical protein
MAEDRRLLLKKLKEQVANFEHEFHRPLTDEEEHLLPAVIRNLQRVLVAQDGHSPSV